MPFHDDDEPRAEKVGELYDEAKTLALINAIFPRSTAEILQRLTGVPIRTVTRWLKGESRVPPTIQEKLRTQRQMQAEFATELQELLEEYAADGAKRAVLRAEVLRTANTFWILENEDF